MHVNKMYTKTCLELQSTAQEANVMLIVAAVREVNGFQLPSLLRTVVCVSKSVKDAASVVSLEHICDTI